MEQPGRALGDMYSSNNLYAWNACGKGVPEQASMWIISTMMRATTTSAIWLACVIAAIPARRAEIIPDREKITRKKNLRTVRAPTRTRPHLDIEDHGK
jgi:hypothetical protein